MKKILLITLILTSIAGYSQVPGSSELIVEDPIETKPEYPGGIEVLKKYITDNIQEANLEKNTDNVRLMVALSFIVEKDGTISNLKVLKDPGFNIGKEMLRVLETDKTKWSPSLLHGKHIRSQYILPINYPMP